jgi:GNAT superfamily N-acetyltransferase
MSRIEVRLAEPSDAQAVAELIRSHEVHYVGADRAASVEDALAMVQASMEAQEGTRFAFALLKGCPVGLACFVLVRPGYKLSGLIHLKELFVEESARGRAVGSAIMRWLADFARARGLGRIDLTTESGNRRARAFYERLGAQQMDKVFYRFNLGTGVLPPD